MMLKETAKNNKSEEKSDVPISEKYLITIKESTRYFNIGEKKLRRIIAENRDAEECFTVCIGNKTLVNRPKFEIFLNKTTAL